MDVNTISMDLEDKPQNQALMDKDIATIDKVDTNDTRNERVVMWW